MWSYLPTRLFGRSLHELPAALAHSATAAFHRTRHELQPAADAQTGAPPEETTVLRTVGWVSAGLGAVALGLFVGRELRQRYKFNRRTPYDFYAHSGDEMNDMEFGVGV